MAASLGQLLVVLIGDQRQVDIYRHLPAEGIIQAHILRGGRQILVAPHHMGDIHSMVIHHIGKIVGGETVRLNQDHIVQLAILHCDITIQLIVKSGSSLIGDILADHKRLACIQIRLHFLSRKSQAVLVVDADLLALHHLGFQRGQTLSVAKAVVSLPLVDEFFGIFHIDAGLHALTLHIRAVTAVLIRTFIVDQPCLCHGAIDDLYSAVHKTFLVRVLNAKHEISSRMFGYQKLVQR